MSALIRERRVVADRWVFAGASAELPAHGDVLVPLALWSAERDGLAVRSGRIGVLLAPADDPAALVDDLPQLALVAVDFPQATDGRGYSTARLLRERYGYTGELRAVGDVGRDQLFYLARVGFDAFALREGEDVAAALAAFADFSEAYQASVERPQPLFRRRGTCASSAIAVLNPHSPSNALPHAFNFRRPDPIG
ncbi:MAG: DUF934 domain-containing protein [Betaproteobacteria bacterium]|nr:DUF934 domain-containing protein [Betaproteobacteria bacterium]